MHVEILNPERILFSGEAKSVRLPGAGGQFEVLEHHAPLLSTLEPGEIRVRDNSGVETLHPVQSGLVEVLANVVTVMI